MTTRIMIGHLRAAELTDLLEGIALKPARAAHLARCPRCRTTLASIAPYFEDVRQPGLDAMDPAACDWEELRSAVRDQLLARAVKRASFVPRWTGRMLTPSAAWGLSVALLVSVMTLGGLWHYRTAHEPAAPGEPGTGGIGTEAGLILDDSLALETEALAWADTEIFVALNELEESEEETLRELIAQTLAEDDGV